METTAIRDVAHQHCRFKLRSGKVVFGVIWEVERAGVQRLFFASVRDYERSQHEPGHLIEVIPMEPQDIVHAERLAS